MSETGKAAAPVSAAQGPEQLRYARLLELGTRVGLVVLLFSFSAYVFNIVPQGWGRLRLPQLSALRRQAGLVVLALVSVVCLLSLVPLYKARGDKAFVAICVAEVVVVLLAASGIFSMGH